MVRRIFLGLVVTMLAAVAAPAAAQGEEFIGSDLGGTPLGTNCPSPDGCVVVQETIGTSPVGPSARGVITAWWTRGAAGPMTLRTYRHRPDEQFVAGKLHATFVDQDAERTGNGSTVPQGFPTRIPVQAGDYIALALAQDSEYGLRQSPPAGTNAFRLFNTAQSDVDVPAGGGDALELYLRAKVEPDVDGDGFGDETQDPCVGCGGAALPSTTAKPAGPAPDPFASIRAKGPRVSIAGKAKASKTGRVPIVLTNPYAFQLKGTLSLRDGKRKAGSKRFTLGPNAKKAVKVKLPRKIFRKLKRRRSLRLTALAKAKARVGKSRTTRKRVRVSAPSRKRKRKRRPQAPAQGPVDGTYRGTTDQGRAITITTINNRRQIRVFATTATTSLCLTNGSQDSPENINILPPVPFPVAADGSFSLDARNEAEDYDPNYRIKGTVTANRVSGFFAWRRTRIVFNGVQSCATREIKFEATR